MTTLQVRVKHLEDSLKEATAKIDKLTSTFNDLQLALKAQKATAEAASPSTFDKITEELRNQKDSIVKLQSRYDATEPIFYSAFDAAWNLSELTARLTHMNVVTPEHQMTDELNHLIQEYRSFLAESDFPFDNVNNDAVDADAIWTFMCSSAGHDHLQRSILFHQHLLQCYYADSTTLNQRDKGRN